MVVVVVLAGSIRSRGHNTFNRRKLPQVWKLQNGQISSRKRVEIIYERGMPTRSSSIELLRAEIRALLVRRIEDEEEETAEPAKHEGLDSLGLGFLGVLSGHVSQSSSSCSPKVRRSPGATAYKSAS